MAADLGIRGAVPDRDLGPWLHDQLGRLARDAPLLLALDDAHRADTASLDVLRALARRGLPAGVVVVVAARSPDAVEHPHWDRALADLTGHDAVTTTELGPLAPDAVAALVRRRLAHLDPGDDLIAAVAERSGGLALHVSALLDLLRRCVTSEEALRAVVEVPGQVRAVVEHQAAQLPPPTRRAVEALAVLRPIDLAGLAAVLGRRPLEVADALEVAVRAGLVAGECDRYVLRHDLDADGLRAGVPPVRAAHLHLARLEALPDDADAFTVLRHTEGAATLLPLPQVATARVDAGIESYRRRAMSEALVLLDAALPGVPDDARPGLLAYRALCRHALGAPDAEEALDDALDAAVAAGDDELAVLVAIGDEPLGLSLQGDPRRLARLQRLIDRPLRPLCRLDLLAATIREAEATAHDSAPALVAEARALADTVARDDPKAQARIRALESRALVDVAFPALERLAVATDAHRLAMATDDPALQLDGIELLMSAELAVGHTERARKLCQELEAVAERWFRPRSIWAALVTESAMLTAEGDPGADDAANRAAARGAELGLPDTPLAAGAHLLVQRLLARERRGRRRPRCAGRPRLGAVAQHRGVGRGGRVRGGVRRSRRRGPRAPRGVRPPRGQPGDVVLAGGHRGRRRGGLRAGGPGGGGRRPRADARRPGRRRPGRVRRRGPRAGDAVDRAGGLDARRRRRGPSGVLRGPRLRRPRRLAAVDRGDPAAPHRARRPPGAPAVGPAPLSCRSSETSHFHLSFTLRCRARRGVPPLRAWPRGLAAAVKGRRKTRCSECSPSGDSTLSGDRPD